jgi:hypothetical protein
MNTTAQIGGSSSRLTRGRAVALIAVAALCALGLWLGPKLWMLVRSTDRFVVWAAEPGVRFEPGAETMAGEVAATLRGAVRMVEQRLGQPFLSPPAVFVCAKLATYKSYVGNATSGGCVINRRLFLSPKPQNTAERIPQLLAHELTHLHVAQRLSLARAMRLPFWFNEGLAVFVSDGGGAENVTVPEARQAIADGRVFVPEGNRAFFWRKGPAAYHLPAHLFYREAGMFVFDIAMRERERFPAFIKRIEKGELPDAAYRAEYGETMAAAWARFVGGIKAAPAPIAH